MGLEIPRDQFRENKNNEKRKIKKTGKLKIVGDDLKGSTVTSILA